VPKPRKTLVSLGTTPYYHCASRCVGRAFLCGEAQSGQSYERRRHWIQDRMGQLAAVFRGRCLRLSGDVRPLSRGAPWGPRA